MMTKKLGLGATALAMVLTCASGASAATYGLGGWAGTQPWRMQRVDQGQDCEVGGGRWICAPGECIVVQHAWDRAWPNGFGGPYAIVRVLTGRFAVGNGQWYVGHCNAYVAPVGTRLHFGQHIAMANHGFSAGWGWAEIGKWDGGPHYMGYGWNYRSLFNPLTVSSSTTTTSSGTLYAMYQVKLTSDLNVRSGPGTSYTRVGGLNSGTVVNVHGVSNGWYKIWFGSTWRWIIGTYTVRTVMSVKLTSDLNVRSGPGTGYTRVGGLSTGNIVAVFGTSGGWYKIWYSNSWRWIISTWTVKA